MSQSSILWLLNSSLILGVFYWSGTASEQIIYDKYLARLEGAEFAVTDYNAAATFYEDVLDFELARPGPSSPILVKLPGGHEIRLSKSENLPGPSRLRLRIRNGFELLHKDLSQRAEAFPESVGPISGTGLERRFVVSDPFGNQIEFVPQTKS